MKMLLRTLRASIKQHKCGILVMVEHTRPTSLLITIINGVISMSKVWRGRKLQCSWCLEGAWGSSLSLSLSLSVHSSDESISSPQEGQKGTLVQDVPYSSYYYCKLLPQFPTTCSRGVDKRCSLPIEPNVIGKERGDFPILVTVREAGKSGECSGTWPE